MNITKSIGLKMAAGTALGLVAIIAIFSYLSIMLTENRLIKSAELEATKTSDAIERSLQTAMLSNDKAWIDSVIYAISQKPMVKDIRILDVKGRIRWAKNKADEGRVLDRNIEMSCRLCHMGEAILTTNRTVHFMDSDGTEVLRNVNPIENNKECHGCHGDSSRLIGKLLVDFTTRDVDIALKESRRVLLTSGIFILIAALIGIWMLFNALVRTPLRTVLEKMKLVAAGDLNAEVAVRGSDEIAELGGQFNEMVLALRQSEDKIKRQMDEMLTLFNVSEILYRCDSIEEAGELITSAMNLGFSVEEASIMVFDQAGPLRVQTTIGLAPAHVEKVRQYIETSQGVRARLLEGYPFRCDGGCEDIGNFLAVPLKAARKVIGVITIHGIRDRSIEDGDVVRMITVVATEVAPHFLAAMQLDEKRALKSGPFISFVESVDSEIAKVKEYYGVLSVGIVKADNYRELCGSIGIEEASGLIQKTGMDISGAINTVHSTVRVLEDSVVVFMPMIDRAEAQEMLKAAVLAAGGDLKFASRVVTYPEDGSTALEIVHAMNASGHK